MTCEFTIPPSELGPDQIWYRPKLGYEQASNWELTKEELEAEMGRPRDNFPLDMTRFCMLPGVMRYKFRDIYPFKTTFPSPTVIDAISRMYGRMVDPILDKFNFPFDSQMELFGRDGVEGLFLDGDVQEVAVNIGGGIFVARIVMKTSKISAHSFNGPIPDWFKRFASEPVRCLTGGNFTFFGICRNTQVIINRIIESQRGKKN